MHSPLALLICIFSIAATTNARAADADDDDKVLGGSPPIYAGLPVTATAQTFRLNRYFNAGRPADSQGLQLGNRCATKSGIFGPGPRMPVGEICAGRADDGRLVRGQVVADGSGKYCTTGQGTFGPGLEQPLGTRCMVETKTGMIEGRIAGPER